MANRKWTLTTMPGSLASRRVFEPLIGVKHFFERPPLKTVLAPAEKICGPCPHRNRTIDGRASSDHLATSDRNRMTGITGVTPRPPIVFFVATDDICVGQNGWKVLGQIHRSSF